MFLHRLRGGIYQFLKSVPAGGLGYMRTVVSQGPRLTYLLVSQKSSVSVNGRKESLASKLAATDGVESRARSE